MPPARNVVDRYPIGAILPDQPDDVDEIR